MPANTSKPWIYAATVTALVSVALTLRLHHLDAEGLFMDELRQVSYYGASAWQMIALAATQNQPPLDYWIGQLFAALANNDFFVRLPAALFGAGAVLFVTLLTSRLAGRGYGILAGLTLALLPFHIYFSQEARPYAGPMFWLALWLYLTLLALQRPEPLGNRFHLGYLATSLAFLYSRTDTPFFTLISAIGLFMLYSAFLLSRPSSHETRRRSARVGSLLLLAIMALLGYLPMLHYLLEAGRRYAPNADSISLTSLWRTLTDLSFEPLAEAFLLQWEPLGLAVAVLLAAGYLLAPRVASRAGPNAPFVWFLYLLLPATALIHLWAYQASTHLPFRPPYPTYLLPLSLPLAAMTIRYGVNLLSPRWQAGLRVIGGGALVVLLTFAIVEFKRTPHHTDWRGMAELLNSSTDTGDVVLTESTAPPGAWDPGDYGFDRYRAGWAIYYPATQLNPDVLQRMLAQSRDRRPFLLYFLWRDYRLTSSSPIPFIGTPPGAWKAEQVRMALSASRELEVRHRTGLLLITLAESRLTHDFAQDGLRLLRNVLSALPEGPPAADLYRTAAVFARTLDAPDAQALSAKANALDRR